MKTLDWTKFSDKHLNYIRKIFSSFINVAEGAVRSGKTVDNVTAAALLIDTSEDRFHLATGATLANAKLNIGDCNGRGLEYLFKGRCKWGKHLDNDALFVNTAKGQKIVIFAGGGKADSFKKILGNSYGIWIATEINNHYNSEDRDSFIDVARDRLIASSNPKIIWDLNPGNPTEDIYTRYIDVYAEKHKNGGLLGGYNYCHFTLIDNLAITEKQKQMTISSYDIGSVNYKRNILGLRVFAEGLIFKAFADNPVAYEWIPQENRCGDIEDLPEFTLTSVGLDIGGTKSHSVWAATGITPGFKKVITYKNKKLKHSKGTIKTDTICEETYLFLLDLEANGHYASYLFVDNAEQVILNSIASYLVARGMNINVLDCKKYAAKTRILAYNLLLNTGRMFFQNCQIIVDALSTVMYDSKSKKQDEILDDFTTDVDSFDAHFYSFSAFLEYLGLQGGIKGERSN